MNVAIVGGSLAGNKGAASMVLGLLDHLGDADVDILTPLAVEDRASGLADGRDVIAFGPVEIVLAVALALVTRVTRGRVATPALRAMWQADVVADVSGISFVDGRGGATLVYNVLLVLAPVLLGRPVVKVSQAMGPFERPETRIAARLVLPRMSRVLARGDRTVVHLDESGFAHEGLVPDSAFLMRVTDADGAWVDRRLDALEVRDRRPVVVAPSQVVVGQADDGGAGYRDAVVALLDRLTEDRDVFVMAHAARPGREAGRLNDLPLCEEVVARSQRPSRCHVVGGDATPRELRALMSRCDLVVASRFHAMISALATATPCLVIGWSHKYREVLREFGHEELALDHRGLATDELLARVDEVLTGRDAVAVDLEARLPAVQAGALANVEAVRAAAADGRGRGANR